MIFLDTHAVVWLYQKELDRFSDRGLEVMERDSLYISPAVLLELGFLQEIGRITEKAQTIVSYLEDRIGLQQDGVSFLPVAETALRFVWTRDPFDRLIVAQAEFHRARLLTKDRIILEHFSPAFW